MKKIKRKEEMEVAEVVRRKWKMKEKA